MNVNIACVRFLDYCRNERQLSQNTLAAYEQDLGEFGYSFSGRLVSQINGEELVEYTRRLATSRKLAPATVKRRLACLRAMFARLRRQNVIRGNPFADVDLRVRIPTRLPRCLSTGEVKSLLEAAKGDSTTYVAVSLLVTTGVRISELAGICLSDFNLDQRSIRIIGKGNRERQVFLPDDALVTILRGYITMRHSEQAGPETRLLVNGHSRPATAACLRNRIKILAQTAGLARRVTPHMLRHTAATALMEAGVDIRFVQRLLGHRSIVTTQIYTHVSDRALKAAIIAANVYRAIQISKPDVQ